MVGGTTVGGCWIGWSWVPEAEVGSAASSRTDSLSKLILTCDHRCCSLLLPSVRIRRSVNWCCCCWLLLWTPPSSSLVPSPPSDSLRVFLYCSIVQREGPVRQEASKKVINNNQSCHHSLSFFLFLTLIPLPRFTGVKKKEKEEKKGRLKNGREKSNEWSFSTTRTHTYTHTLLFLLGFSFCLFCYTRDRSIFLVSGVIKDWPRKLASTICPTYYHCLSLFFLTSTKTKSIFFPSGKRP